MMSELEEHVLRCYLGRVGPFLWSAEAQDILVVGCGLGHLAWALERKGHRVWAAHDSQAFAFQLQEWSRERLSEVEFFAARPLHIQPFSDGYFDSVVIVEEIGCYEEIYALFEEANRIVGPGGLVLGTHLLRNCSPRRQLRNLTVPLLEAFIAEKSQNGICGVTELSSGFVFAYRSPGARCDDE